MSSINPLDRFSLCRFTFADGRGCRTPRLSTNPNFCHYHAQLAVQAQLTSQLANELSQLLATPNLSPNDLSAALARLIPAVLDGRLKIRTARTVAYLLQTLLQTIRLSQLDRLQLAPPELPPPPMPSIPSPLPPADRGSHEPAAASVAADSSCRGAAAHDHSLGTAAARRPFSSTHQSGDSCTATTARPAPNKNAPIPVLPSARAGAAPTPEAVNAALAAARRLFPAHAGPLGSAGACSRFSSDHQPRDRRASSTRVPPATSRTPPCAPSNQAD